MGHHQIVKIKRSSFSISCTLFWSHLLILCHQRLLPCQLWGIPGQSIAREVVRQWATISYSYSSMSTSWYYPAIIMWEVVWYLSFVCFLKYMKSLLGCWNTNYQNGKHKPKHRPMLTDISSWEQGKWAYNILAILDLFFLLFQASSL